MPGAEGRGFIPVGEDDIDCFCGEFMRAGVRSAAEINEAGKAFFIVSAAPFEDSVNGAAEFTGGLFLAMCFGIHH